MRGVVLVRIDARTEMVGAIHVPHVARDLPNTGVVVRVGSEVPATIGVGAHVLIERYAHGDREFLMLGEPAARHLMVKSEQVVAVLS